MFPKAYVLCITDSSQKLVCLYHSAGTLLNGNMLEAPAMMRDTTLGTSAANIIIIIYLFGIAPHL